MSRVTGTQLRGGQEKQEAVAGGNNITLTLILELT